GLAEDGLVVFPEQFVMGMDLAMHVGGLQDVDGVGLARREGLGIILVARRGLEDRRHAGGGGQRTGGAELLEEGSTAVSHQAGLSLLSGSSIRLRSGPTGRICVALQKMNRHTGRRDGRPVSSKYR